VPLSSTAAPEALAGGWRAQLEREYNEAGAGGVPMGHLREVRDATVRVANE
jgi:hypothetical protein